MNRTIAAAICFALGAIGFAAADTGALRPEIFITLPWTWSGVQSYQDGKLVLNGASSGSSTIKAPATGGGTVTLPSGSGTLSFSAGAGTVTSVVCGTGLSGGTITTTGTCALDLTNANTWTAAQQFNSGDLKLKGATSGTVTLNAAVAAGSNTLTLPAGTTDFSSTGGTSQVVKQTSSGGAFTVARLGCMDLSDGAGGCSTAIGTSGATIPLLNGANTWSGVQSISDGDLALKGSSSGATTLKASAAAGTTTITFPAATDTVAALGTAQSWTATQTFDTSHTVTGLPSPSGSSDAATKGYVDGQVIAAGSGTVTSVGLSVPGSSLFGTSGTPVTTTGTLGLTTTGTSGGIPYFDTTSTLSSSGALTNHALVLGGGAGAAPTVLGSLGTSTTLLHGAAAGAPTFGAVVTGDITDANVTYAKIQNVAASSLLGNPTGSSAAPSGITLGTGLAFSSTTLVPSGVPLSTLATQSANTIVANVSGSTAAPTAATIPSCTDTGGNHLNYTNGTGLSCGTSGGGGGGGAMALISTQTASGSADLRWTGLGSTYNVYLLTCTDVIPATASANLLTQFGEGGTPTWETSSYASVAGTLNSSAGSNSQTATTGFIWNSVALSNAGDGVQGIQWIHSIASTVVHKFVHGTAAISYNTSGDAAGNTMIGTYKGDTNAVTAIRVIMSSGNITSGECSLFGLTP